MSFSTNVPFFPLSMGNKIYRPLSFCSEWGEIPYKRGATCLPWVASRMLEKGILVVEGSPGISSFATHYFGPCLDRRAFRVRPDPFQSARSCLALEVHYFSLYFRLSIYVSIMVHTGLLINTLHFSLYEYFDGQRLMG